MKKIIYFLVLLLIPINTHATNYITKVDGYIVHITDEYKINDNQINIIDDRKNSNIKIVNSYKIKNNKLKLEIINEILDYSKKYPNGNWIRTNNSMYLEWQIHNLFYSIGIKRNHTASVDFGKNEEHLYNLLNLCLQKIIYML